MIDSLLLLIFILMVGIVVYHHLLYPLILNFFSRRSAPHQNVAFNQRYYQRSENDAHLPTITIAIPANNERVSIIEKLQNLQLLDYPRDRLWILLLCDGCDDGTDQLAIEWVNTSKESDFQFEIKVFPSQQGKVAMINYALKQVKTDLLFLSDASALLSFDALLIAAVHFADPKVGVVAATYRLISNLNPGESLYWEYQIAIKKGEAVLGAPIGAHGSGYLIRMHCAQPLAADTINDDLILPLQIVAQGYRMIYETRLITIEMESSPIEMDLERRKRISTGNWQQIIQLKALLHPRFGGTSFNFISGKMLRVVMPLALVFIFLSSLGLVFYHPWFVAIVILQLLIYGMALVVQLFSNVIQNKIIKIIHYFVYSHLMTFIGLYRYLTGYYQNPWYRISPHRQLQSAQFIHPVVKVGKWLIDKLAAILGLSITLLMTPIIALFIKLDSPGPVFHQQFRVGRQWPDYTELFTIYKFRTMVVDAESEGKARWAKLNDPRITRVGHYLRKMRIDELPQFLNVLLGQMSLFGPRPERPAFYTLLERAIPFYAERIYGVTPGITGLAQVLVGYDQSIEDVKRKIAFDHAYALALTKPWPWVKMEFHIALLTIKIILFGRGQ